jgi:hypothetical protein
MPIADDQERFMVEGMSDDILVEIVAEVAIEPGQDVL